MTTGIQYPQPVPGTEEQVRIRIAIADDHDLMRAGLRALLSARGDIDIIWEATNAQRAGDMIDVEKPDILLVDPELGGALRGRLARAGAMGMAVILLSKSDTPRSPGKPRGAFHLDCRAGRRELDRLIGAARSTENPPAPPGEDAVRSVDPADVLILALVAAGRTNRQIARQLGKEEEAVKAQLRDLFARWKVGSRSAAVVKAIRLGIIE